MVVQASTRSAFGQRENNNVFLNKKTDRRPMNPYGASKVAADAFAHCYSHLHEMNVTLIRIFAAYGPRGRPDMIPRILVENIVNDKPIRKFGDGTATRTWIYISDIAKAFLLALRHPQGGFAEFNIGVLDLPLSMNLLLVLKKSLAERPLSSKFPYLLGMQDLLAFQTPNRLQKRLVGSRK